MGGHLASSCREGEGAVYRQPEREIGMTVSPRLVNLAYALMRVFAGLLFAMHGAQKLFGVLGGKVMTGNPLMLTAGIIEFVGGLLIAVGLLTRIAAFLASGEMAVAYFKAHAPQGFWPVENQGELPVLYCFVFLFIAAYGGGVYSLDHALRRRGAPVRT
jgi:putative oxidoreductase